MIALAQINVDKYSWKGTGILILVIIIGFIVASFFFK
ncbi:DUF6366 family protein [Rossellomorea sp. BNER]